MEDRHFTKPVNVDHNAARCSKTADEKTGLSCALLPFRLFGLSGKSPPDVMMSLMQFLLHLGKPVLQRERVIKDAEDCIVCLTQKQTKIKDAKVSR